MSCRPKGDYVRATKLGIPNQCKEADGTAISLTQSFQAAIRRLSGNLSAARPSKP
jgi:hypothetical protein